MEPRPDGLTEHTGNAASDMGHCPPEDTGEHMAQDARQEEQVRDRLRAERAAVLARAGAIGDELAAIVEAVASSNADDEHDPEGATLGFERAQVATLLHDAARRLVAVDRALARVDAGTYATCAGCGGPIAPGRLQALPTTDRCITCVASPDPARRTSRG